MKNNITSAAIASAVFAASFFGLIQNVHAQTTGSTTGMTGTGSTATTNYSSPAMTTTYTEPAFYNTAGGSQVNNGNTTSLPAGTYYNSAGQPIYYYGNGTYYDPSTDTYGGSIYDPSGVAGIYSRSGTTGIYTPGLPNTGAGGEATLNWLSLLITGIVGAIGLGFVSRQVANNLK